MQSHLSRRSLLTTGAVGLASLCVAPQSWAAELSSKPVYSGPNIFLIRFGGGVRRQETIDPDQTYAPFLRHTLAQRGTLFPQMELDQLKQVTTSHGEGTLHILTGKYGDFIRTDGFGDRLESRAPTLFEYLRKQYAIAEHQTLLINGEDRTSEEFYSFSNHHLFGVNYRCQVLSLYRFKIYLLQQQIEAGNLQEIDLEKKIAELQHLEGLNYRQADRKGNSPEMSQFWKRWHQYYGSSGLVNPRGDRVLTELAIWAIQQLRPKFLMINYSDPDYVHWGYPSHYHNGIAIIDQGIKSIVQTLEADPEYRDNTVLCIVPDCGRDSNQFLTVPYQHHFGSRSAHEIFALFVGKGIRANQIVDLRVSQVDVAPTLAHLMGCQAEYAEGSVLEEVFA